MTTTIRKKGKKKTEILSFSRYTNTLTYTNFISVLSGAYTPAKEKRNNHMAHTQTRTRTIYVLTLGKDRRRTKNHHKNLLPNENKFCRRRCLIHAHHTRTQVSYFR